VEGGGERGREGGGDGKGKGMGEGEGRERAGEGKESPPKIYDMASSMAELQRQLLNPKTCICVQNYSGANCYVYLILAVKSP
jgi:hypothetical protein